jgi:PAS domain S-box-containing protein
MPRVGNELARGGGGSLAVIVVDRRGAVQLADGEALSTFAEIPQALGEQATKLFAGQPPLRSAIEGAMVGESLELDVSAGGHVFDVTVEPRREGGALVAAVDVTKRRDGSVRDSDRQLGLIFRQVPGAAWTTDLELRVTHAYGRVAAELRLRLEDIVGSHVPDVLGTRDESDAIMAAHRAALTGRKSAYRYSFRGRSFGILTEPLRDDHRQIIGTVSAAIDVTDELAIERRLADAQRIAHVGSWEWDVQKNTVMWSDEMFRIYGLEPTDSTWGFEGFLARVAPEDVAHTKEVVFGAFRSPGPFGYDHRITRPDGSVRMLHTRGDVLVDTAGKPTRMLGSCWDITDRWETSRALERTTSLLQATLDATVDGIIVVDAQGKRITASNRRFVEMWSLPPELVADGDAGAVLAFTSDLVDDPVGYVDGVLKLHASPEKDAFDVIRFRDGRVFERSSRPQRLGNEIVGRVWSYRDITERERLFQRAVFLADAGRLLSSLDVERALSSVANLAVPFLGDTCAIDLLGEGPPRRFLSVAGDRSFSPELSPAVLKGRSVVYSVAGRTHMAVPLRLDGLVTGAIIFAAARGGRYSTVEVEAGEELARRISLALEKSHLLQRTQDALRAREEFLTIAAHEIRGPVTAMHTAVQALLRKKLSEPSSKRALELIQREDRRLARFVDELLDLGHTKDREAAFESEIVSLARVVREVVSRHEDEIARSGSSVTMDLDENTSAVCGRERLEKVFGALLSNAVKFGLGKPIEITARSQGDRAVLRVLDHGIGIAKSAQQRIFAPFERAVSVRHYGGLGLGLYIASSMVKEMGGTIAVESEPGVGSIFVVELPGGKAT